MIRSNLKIAFYLPLLIFQTLGFSCSQSQTNLWTYNDHWNGEVWLEKRPIPFSTTIYITASDEKEIKNQSSLYSKFAFAEIKIDNIGPFAGMGTVSNYNYTELDKNSYQPEKTRDFINLHIASAGLIVSSEKTHKIEQRYRKNYADMIKKLGHDSSKGSCDVHIIGEHRRGTLRGVILLKISKARDCVQTQNEGCNTRNIKSIKRTIGNFTLIRREDSQSIQHKNQNQIVTDHFIFKRTQDNPHSISHSVHFLD